MAWLPRLMKYVYINKIASWWSEYLMFVCLHYNGMQSEAVLTFTDSVPITVQPATSPSLAD